MDADGTEEDSQLELRFSLSTQEYLIQLRNKETNFDSPINLNITYMKEIYLPNLEWRYYDVPPKKVKLTNSGRTVILSAKWVDDRPYLSGGPLSGNYIFSQLHFHWGANDMEGSEHTVDGSQYPVEMHVVHFRSDYNTQEQALHESDGVAVLVYFLKLQSQSNPHLQELVDNFITIQKSFTSIKLASKPINILIPYFKSDYFMYWGEIKTSTQNHVILWIICRTPIGISAEQVDYFRTILDENEEPLVRNFREIGMPQPKQVFHVNSSPTKYSTLLPIPRDEVPKKHKQ